MSNAGRKTKKAQRRRDKIDQNLTYDSILEHNLFDSLLDSKKAPDEFLGIVRSIVEYENNTGDFQFSNTDPFHFQSINEERIKRAGDIKGFRKFRYAMVEVPLLYNNIYSTAQNSNVSLFTLTKIEITSVTKKLRIGEAIYIKFNDNEDHTNGRFIRVASDKVITVADADNTSTQSLDGTPLGVERETIS